MAAPVFWQKGENGQLSMPKLRQAGLVVGATLVLIVKLVPAVLAETKYCAASEAPALLQVTPSLVPSDSSKVTQIWLIAETEVVLTTTVVAAAAMTTLPRTEFAHTAGDAELEQFDVVFTAGWTGFRAPRVPLPKVLVVLP